MIRTALYPWIPAHRTLGAMSGMTKGFPSPGFRVCAYALPGMTPTCGWGFRFRVAGLGLQLQTPNPLFPFGLWALGFGLSQPFGKLLSHSKPPLSNLLLTSDVLCCRVFHCKTLFIQAVTTYPNHLCRPGILLEMEEQMDSMLLTSNLVNFMKFLPWGRWQTTLGRWGWPTSNLILYSHLLRFISGSIAVTCGHKGGWHVVSNSKSNIGSLYCSDLDGRERLGR